MWIANVPLCKTQPEQIFTPKRCSPLKNIHPWKIFTPENIHPWKIFTPERYSPLKNIYSWKIFTPEKYSPLKNIHHWKVKWLNTQTCNAMMIYPCHLLLYRSPPSLPLGGWWRRLWTVPKLLSTKTINLGQGGGGSSSSVLHLHDSTSLKIIANQSSGFKI